jgi:TPR repeat protein
MPDGGSLDKKVTSFVVGLVASVGITYAKKFVARKYGEDSQVYQFLEEHYTRFAREVHDHLTGEPQPQPIAISHDRPDFDAGKRYLAKEDWNNAYLSFMKAEQAGDAAAANYVGYLYWKGRVNWPGKAEGDDFRLAVRYFEKAIAGGETTYAPAHLTNVGYEYDSGMGVAKDEAQGHRCYEIAAKAGNQQAMFNLACNYGAGCGTPTDKHAARHWFRMAAARTDTEQAKALAARAAKFLAELDAEEQRERNQRQAPNDGRMSRARALEIFDIHEGASPREMKIAYMRLMQSCHPDKGGSNYFAKQLNEAREVLGF